MRLHYFSEVPGSKHPNSCFLPHFGCFFHSSFAVCGSFFQYTIDEGLTADANPIRSVKQKSNFKQRNTVISSGKALTPRQWNYVIETAEVMAAEDPRRERTLFIVATLFSLYLRISSVGTTGSLQWVRLSTTVKTGGSTLSVRATRP